MKKLIIILLLFIPFISLGYKTSVNFDGGRKLVTVYDWQLEIMKDKGYSKTRILDLLAIRSMECNKYNGNCMGYGGQDYGPFQINKIHTDEYRQSIQYRNKREWDSLFIYQLEYVNQLVESYMNRYCKWKRTYTNKNRFKCIYVSYNGSDAKYYLSRIAWKKRKAIKQYIYDL